MVISIALAHPEIQVIQVVEIKDKEGGSPPAQYKLRKRDGVPPSIPYLPTLYRLF